MTRRLIAVAVALAAVVIVLAGGFAFIQQYLREQEWKQLSATAEEKIAARRLDEAVAVLRRIEAAGGNARATWQLGRALWEMNQRQPALEVFSRLETKWPTSEYMADVLLYRARFAGSERQDFESARELFYQVLERFPNSPQAHVAAVEIARATYERGNIPVAKAALEKIAKEAKGEAKLEAELLLGEINMNRLLSPTPQPEDETYVIQRGDRLSIIARKLTVPLALLESVNGLNPTALTIGRVIRVPRLKVTLVVDRTERTLTVLNADKYLKKYRVGIPREDRRLPIGDYRVTEKTDKGMDFVDPQTNSVIKAGVADNPYGPRVFLSLNRGLAIHGTDNPAVVGTYTTRGYISMRNTDVEELTRILMVGNPVTIKGEIRPLADVSKF